MNVLKSVVLPMLLLLSLMLVGCGADAPVTDDAQEDKALSLARLTEYMPMDEAQADALLSHLASLGYSGRVLLAYPATDEEGREYYHIWIGEQTLDVYLDATVQVLAVARGGIALWGELPDVESAEGAPKEKSTDAEQGADEPAPTEQKDGAKEALTVRLHEATECVGRGEMASVIAYGEVGVTYRIEVHYASGVSSAQGLEPQTADEAGRLAWEWRVSANTRPGDFYILILRDDGKSDALRIPFSVLE